MFSSLFPFAFLAGIFTVALPCIIPLLPGILAGSLDKRRLRPLGVTLGIIISFTVTGTVFGIFLNFFGLSQPILRNIAIFFLLIFGWAMIFPIIYERVFGMIRKWRKKISADQERAIDAPRKEGFWSAMALGASLGLVWTPCAGPILGLMFTFALMTESILKTGILFFVYSLGVGIPLLLLAYGGQTIFLKMKILSQNTLFIKRIAGMVLILWAFLMLLDFDRALQTWLVPFFPEPRL